MAMFKKSYYFFILFCIGGVVFFLQLFYIYAAKNPTTLSLEKKNNFVKISGLPDLALSTETNSVRHRSLSDIFSVYKEDGTLWEYFPSTYVYTPPRGIYER